MVEPEEIRHTRDYSFKEHEAEAGLLVGPYVVRYTGRIGPDLCFHLSVFDPQNRYKKPESIMIRKVSLMDELRLEDDTGVEYSIRPKEEYSEVTLDIRTSRNMSTEEEIPVTTLKELLIPKSSETPLTQTSGLTIITHPLDQVVHSLAHQTDLEGFLLPTPTWVGKVLDLTARSTSLAFGRHDPKALLAVHRSLKTLYDLHLFPQSVGSKNQYNPFLGGIRKIAEDGWMDFEEGRMTVDPEAIPHDKQEFADYFRNMVLSHPAANHRLYNFLQDQASVEQVTKFLLTEYALNIRFFDIIVLAALGTEGGIRREVSQNLWDESGTGMEEKAHTRLFKHLLETLGIVYSEDGLVDQLGWQGLAGYNLFLNLGLSRKNYYRFVGCLGATELLDPPNYTKFMSGCRRLGLDQAGDFTYYTEHIEVDVKHGSGWIDNVMLSLLDTSEDTAFQFLSGAEMRLNTCHDYYESMYSKFCPQPKYDRVNN